MEYSSIMMYPMLLTLFCNLHKVWPVRSLLPLDAIGNFNRECTVTPLTLEAALPVVAVTAHLL